MPPVWAGHGAIAHEPKRLTKRYTVEALDFVAHAPQLVSRLEAMGSSSIWGSP